MVPVIAQTTGTYMIKKWGEFGDKAGQFKYPAMIALDKNSNIYIVDQHNHRIQKFDSEGNFILMWGRQGDQTGEFNFPYGIATDSGGNVYVSDMNNNRIQKFSPEGEFLGSVGTYGTEKGQFKYPYGIAMDDKDNLYVIDAFNYRIQKFSSDLKYLSAWGDQESLGIKLYMPHEIAVTKEGNIILSDRQNHRISFFTSNGTLIKRIGEFGEGMDAGGCQFSEPHGIAVNGSGEILICDRYNFRIQKLNPDGVFITQWKTSEVPDNSRYFPIGITIAKNGSVYVTDHYAHCVQKY
jgi:DNA-binding beta-propeller fold protein YncE